MQHPSTRPPALGLFKRLLTPPLFVNEDSQTRPAANLNAVLVVNLIFALPLGLFVFFTSQHSYLGGLVAFMITLIASITPLFILHRGKMHLAAGIFLVSLWLMTSGAFLISNGATSMVGSIYIAVMTMSLLFFGWRASVFSGVASLVFTLFLSAADLSGIPKLFVITPLASWMLLFLALVLILIPLGGMYSALVKALGNVQEQLSAREKAEQTLRDNEERFRLISKATSDYTFSTYFDEQGNIISHILDGAFEKITGYTTDEFINMGGWTKILYPADFDQYMDDARVLYSNQTMVSEARIIRKDGQLVWVRVSAFPMWDAESQKVIGINGGVQDINARKKAEQVLRDNEERFRLISTVTSDYTFSSRFNEQGRLQHQVLSGAFEKITGYTPDEFSAVGGWTAILHPDDREQDKRDVDLLRENRPITSELRIIRKDGKVYWVRVSANPIWNAETQTLIGINGGVQDITARKQAEAAIRDRETLLRAVIDHLPDTIYAKDLQGRYLINNTESLRRIGASTQAEVLGKTDSDFFSPELAAQWWQAMEQVIESGKPRLNQEVYFNLFEGISWLSASFIPLRNAEGTVIGLVVINRDITAHKLAEQAVQRSEASLRALLDATNDVAFLMSADYRILTANKPMAKAVGKPLEEIIGSTASELVSPEMFTKRRHYFEQVIETKQPVRWIDNRNTEQWDNSIYPVLSVEGEVESFAVFGRDISEEVRLATELQRYATQLEHMVEERTIELRRAKDQIEIILNNTRDAIALAHPNGDIQTRNPAFVAMFGEQVSRWIEGLLWTVASEEHSGAVGQALVEMMHTREGKHIETQITVDDKGDKDIDLMFIPVSLETESEQPGILVSAHDITRLKEIERFKARFIADAVHDLATPIAGLSTRLYLLKRSPENLDVHMKALENQVEHFRDLLSDLRTLSQLDRKQITLDLQIVNIHQNIVRVFDTYEPVALSKDQMLELHLDPDLPDMLLDRRQIERVFLNLVSNAINYSPEGKTIRIRVTREGDDLLFAVTDEGIGMSAEEQAHVFERFYRSARARQTRSSGTGLGLAIVKEIVDLHGGTVAVYSEAGKGSTFTVRLPINPR